jgi:hypothetical protein
MAQDDDGFAVVLPTQQRAECTAMPDSTQNAKDTQSNPSTTDVLLSGELGTVAAQHHAEHAVAVFSFALEVLAIVSVTRQPVCYLARRKNKTSLSPI